MLQASTRLTVNRGYTLHVAVDDERTNKMKIYFKLILGLLVITGIYFSLSTYQRDPIPKPEKKSDIKPGRPLQSLISEETNDVYYAILLMPKSYRPLLERFAKHKLAKAIQIVPAKVGWHENKLMVVPKKPISKKNSHPAGPGPRNQLPVDAAALKPAPDFGAKIRAAALLAFLAEVEKGRFK